MGEVDMLVRQLERRFGHLSQQLRARIASAGEEELLRWADRFVDAATLEDVFEDQEVVDPGDRQGR